MKAFKRAWLYITRRKTKTILLMITFFLIGNLVILGMGISQASDNAKILTRKSMNPVVSYERDYKAFDKYVDSLEDEDEIEKAYDHFPQIDGKIAKKIGEDPRVRAMTCYQQGIANSVGFENLPVGNEDKKRDTPVYDVDGNQFEVPDSNIATYATYFDNMIEFEDGTFTMVDGHMISQSDIDAKKYVCVVTKDLAELNGFHVGDSIRLRDRSTIWMQKDYQEHGITDFTDDDFVLEYEIVGIYETKREVDTTSDAFNWMEPWENPKNVILIPYGADKLPRHKEMMEKNREVAIAEGWLEPDETREEPEVEIDYLDSVVFLLNDPLEVDQFVSDYQADLGEYTKLNANNEMFKKMARPLDTLSFFSNIIVAIVIVNAIVIISLVTALTLKTRQYEMGVLLSIGVSKFKVVSQLFLELILIALLGFGLAAVSGSMIAGSVGERVLNYQTEVDSQYNDEDEFVDDSFYWTDTSDYFTDITQEDLLSQYEVSVSPALIGEIFVIGAGVVLLAIIVPSFMIMRLNPKQILLEQN